MYQNTTVFSRIFSLVLLIPQQKKVGHTFWTTICILLLYHTGTVKSRTCDSYVGVAYVELLILRMSFDRRNEKITAISLWMRVSLYRTITAIS